MDWLNDTLRGASGWLKRIGALTDLILNKETSTSSSSSSTVTSSSSSSASSSTLSVANGGSAAAHGAGSSLMLLDSVLEAFRVLQMAMNELTRHLLSNLELLRSPVASSTTLAPDDLTDDPAVAYRRAMEQPRGAFVSQILVLAAAVVWAALAGGYACVREAYRLHLLHARSWAAVAVCASGNPAVERSVRICAECYAALRAVADGMIERLRIFVAARPASQRVARDAPELPVEWAIKHAFAPRLAALSQRAALLAAEGEDLFS